MSLQAAVDAKDDKGPDRKHVRILWAVEKDPACQKVLASTYGCCCFGDILDLASDLTQKEMYCTTHEKMCPCTVPKRARRVFTANHGSFCCVSGLVNITESYCSWKSDEKCLN